MLRDLANPFLLNVTCDHNVCLQDLNAAPEVIVIDDDQEYATAPARTAQNRAAQSSKSVIDLDDQEISTSQPSQDNDQ